MVVVICLSSSDDPFIQHSLGDNPIERLKVVLLSKLAPPVAHWARTGEVADSTHVAPRPTVPQPGRPPAPQKYLESHTYELPSQGSNLSIVSRIPAPTRDRNNPGKPGWHPAAFGQVFLALQQCPQLLRHNFRQGIHTQTA